MGNSRARLSHFMVPTPTPYEQSGRSCYCDWCKIARLIFLARMNTRFSYSGHNADQRWSREGGLRRYRPNPKFSDDCFALFDISPRALPSERLTAPPCALDNLAALPGVLLWHFRRQAK